MVPSSPSRRRGISRLFLALALTLAAVFGGGYLLLGRSAGPVAESAETFSKDGLILYEVPRNATATFLAYDLHAKGLLPFPFIFKMFIRVTGQARRIRAGYYYLPPHNSVLELAYKLTSGKMATQTVTIPEGKTSWEIYGLLKAHFDIDSARFDSLVHSQSFAHSLGLKAPGLEGYLFPDTYILPYRISSEDVLRIMVRRFQQEIADLPHDSSAVLRRYGELGWVTLASIVEKEAAVRNEQALIAGVFFNRLQQGWTLGADPTVRYAVHKITGPLYVDDLNVNSPYNTRRFPGLPPGPICNPGKSALLAALQPENTKMMFFVAKDDGSHEHYFSATNEDHDRYKAMAADNRRAQQAADSETSSTADPKTPPLAAVRKPR